MIVLLVSNEGKDMSLLQALAISDAWNVPGRWQRDGCPGKYGLDAAHCRM
jgi:hypothetical protein